MLPLKIYTRKKIFNYYTGLSFFIFIWLSHKDKDHVRLIRHETIHFWQQVEMLFIFHWLFYAIFYIVARIKGHCHYIAYRFNPFEIEAFNNESDTDYLQRRKPLAWLGYLTSYNIALHQDLTSIVPKEKLIKW
jgi:predicted membrane protein